MSRSALHWAIALWAVIVTVIGIRVAVRPGSHSVYPIFIDAGRNWLVGDDVYGALKPGLDQYRYSPVIAAAFAPWTVLPDRVGEVLWRCLNAGVLLAGLAIWCRWWWGGTKYVAAMLVLIVPLSIGSLNNGQCNCLIAGLLVAAVAAFATERWLAAAVAIAVATLLKGYPLGLGLLLCLVEPRRFAPRLACVLVLGMAVPFVLQNPDYVSAQYTGFVERLQGDDRTVGSIERSYRDFHLLLRVWGWPLSLSTYRAVEAAAGAACALFVLFARLSNKDRRPAIAACGTLGISWMCLFGPATESCTYALLAPVLAYAAVEAPHRPGWQKWLTYASYAGFTCSTIGVWFPPSFNMALQTHGILPVSASLLLICTCADCFRQLRKARDAAVMQNPRPIAASEITKAASAA